MWISFYGWFLKRVGCGLLGSLFSLLFCQIQDFLSLLSCCLKLKHLFYVLGLLLTLGLPWCMVHFVSSGVDLLESCLLPIPSQRPISITDATRLQHRSYRRHVKFKTTSLKTHHHWKATRHHLNATRLDRWGSLPELFLHVQPLLGCFPSPPVVPVSRAKVFDVMWTEAYWEQLINDFIISQNPSCIVETCQLCKLLHTKAFWLFLSRPH